MKRHLAILLSFLFLQIPLKAQYTNYSVDVSSFGEYDMIGKTYVIIPANEELDVNDLEFKEYSSYVKKVLAVAGAREASDFINADLCILMHYEITDKSYEETVSRPVFGQTGIKSITTNTNTTTNRNTYGQGSVSTYGNSAYGNANINSSANRNTTSTSNINYSYGVTGYRTVQRHVEKYLRIINLYAYENVENSPMVWKRNIMSDGSSDKLRELIPVMSYCAIDKIGVNYEGNFNLYPDGHMSFDFFKKFKLNNNMHIAPLIEYYSNEGIGIVAIERKPNETIVFFHKQRGIEKMSISPQIYLEYSGNKVYPVNSVNIKLGKTVKDVRGLFFAVHFPAIPKDVTQINISEEEDLKIKDPVKRKYWKGIQLVK